MEEKVILPPCPYCSGPPVRIVTKAPYLGGGIVNMRIIGEDGIDAEGYVFCHECGAEGPKAEMIIYDIEDCVELERRGVDLWLNRDSRNADLYDSNMAEYPRE